MNIKENDNLPNSEVFALEDGEPVKKTIEDLFKNKKVILFLSLIHISEPTRR